MSRPDICARLARFSANFNGLQVIDISRINDLMKTAKDWQSACASKYFAGRPRPVRRPLSCPDDGWGRPRPIHEGTMILSFWSDAAFGTHLQDGRCRLGYIIALMSSTLTGSAHIPQWPSKFTRKYVKSSLGGEIFALSDMRDHAEMIREFFTALGHEKIRSYGLIDCESLLPHLRTERLGTEKFGARQFRSILDALGSGDLGNVAWIPVTGNPADGVAIAEGELGPFFHLLDTVAYRPGRLELLRGVSFIEKLV